MLHDGLGPVNYSGGQLTIFDVEAMVREEFDGEFQEGYNKSRVRGAVENAVQYSGMLAARVAVLAHQETRALADHQFLDGASEQGLESAAAVAAICAESQKAKARDINLPFGTVRFGRFNRIPTNYDWLASRLYPRASATPFVRSNFAEGYAAEARLWGLDEKDPYAAKKSIKKAPAMIKGVWIGNIKEGDGRFVTEDGAVLTLRDGELPAGSAVLHNNTRYKGLRAPNDADISDLMTVIAQSICGQVDIKSNREEARELIAEITREEIMAGGWLQELIEGRITCKWRQSGRVVAHLAKLAVVETGSVEGANGKLFMAQATGSERHAVHVAATDVQDAQKQRVRMSYLPWERPIRFTGLDKVRTLYSVAHKKQAPRIWHSKLAKESFQEGVVRGARALGLRILCTEHGRALIDSVPRQIEGIFLDPEGQDSRRFVTDRGAVLQVPASANAPALPVSLTPASIEERTNSVRPPTPAEVKEVQRIIGDNVTAQVGRSFQAPAKRTQLRPPRF